MNVTADFDFTAPDNADFCLQVHIFERAGEYHALYINPKAVTRSTLLHEYNGFIYLLKGCCIVKGQKFTAELIVNRKDIPSE